MSKHGVVVTSNFSFPVVPSWGFSSLSSNYPARVQAGKVTSVRFGVNFPQYFIMPKNR